MRPGVGGRPLKSFQTIWTNLIIHLSAENQKGDCSDGKNMAGDDDGRKA